MPYVQQDERENINARMDELLKTITSVGQLNYAITRLCINHVDVCGECYGTFNAIVGVLECAKQEFYRRAVALYEDRKLKENGDVY